MAQGGTNAKSQINLATYNNPGYTASCSLIATDNGSGGNSFQINLKTSGNINNTQFTPFYISPAGNVGIGTITAGSILQVGNAGRLKIGSGTTDYSLIGTLDTDDNATNTKIFINGNTCTYAGAAGFIQYFASSGGHVFYASNAEKMRIANNGNITNSGTLTTGGNIDCGGGIAINGSDAFFSTAPVNSGNLTNTYINFKFAGTNNDWCYLRQIGGDNAFKLAFDFHDDDADARFCIRKVQSAGVDPDIISEVFTVNNGNVGINNTSPWLELNLGDVSVAGSSGSIAFGKNNGAGGIRQFRQGYSSNFFFCLGDCGNINSSSAPWTLQMAISYQAPASSLTISSSGQLIIPYGSTSSDERIKSNIKTIEHALEKTLLLRGVEYNNFKIDPDKKCLGLIAQEVELIIPEVVSENEMDNVKCISYNSLIGVLIEAIKEQQQQINELKNILKNNNIS